MADVTKTIDIIFQGVDRVSSSVTSVSSGIGSLSGQIEAAAKPFAAFADGVLAADAALAALAVGGLVVSVNKAVEFENSMVDLKKVVGEDLSGALDAAKKNAISLSDQYGVSAKNIVSSTADFAQAGFSVQEAMKLAKDALDLVIAGDMDAAQASDLLVASLKGFQAPASDAGRLIDILNEVSNKYATNVEQLSIGMAGLSPIAKQMGLSFEDTAGILTPVIEIFRSGDEAATALKTGLLKLIDDSKPVKEALASIGVAQTDANGQLRSGKDILNDVTKAFTTLDDKQKLYITSQIVGIDQAAKMVTVFDGLAKSSEITAVALGASGSAAKEVAAKLESTQATIDRFKTGFENLAIAIGDKFLESTRGVVSGATDMENAIRTAVNEGSFDPLFNAVDSFGDKLGGLLREIAQAFPEAMKQVNFNDLLDALGELGDEFGDLFGDLDLTQPEDLAKAIQWVVDSIESLVHVTSGMVEAFKPMVDGMINSVTGFNQLDESSQRSAGNIAGMAKGIVDAGGLIVGALITIGQNADTMKGAFDTVINSVLFLWNSAKTTIDAIVITLIDALQGVVSVADTLSLGTFGDELGGLQEKLDGWKENFQQAFIDNALAARDNLGEVADAMSGVGDEAEAATGKVSGAATAIDSIPDEKNTAIGLSLSDIDAGKWFEENVDSKVPSEKAVAVTPAVDSKKLEEASKTIQEKLPDAKIMDIQAKVEIARIDAEAEKVKAAFDAMGEIAVAQIEADADRVKSAFESIGNTVSSTTDLIGSLVGSMSEFDAFDQTKIWDLIRHQEDMQRDAFDLQQKLTEEQISYMKMKREKMSQGDALVKIEAMGLEPEIEAFMWRILEKIQIRVAEEQSEFLLGIA